MAALAVLPTLNRAPRKAHNHPSYTEMIVAAIGSLKEKKGSTESSIAAYISSKYKNLPPSHNAQLSLHLKDLKKQGLVETVESYKLTAGENTSNSVSKRRGRPMKNPGALTSPSSGKGKRGRPFKVAPPSGPTLILPQHMKAYVKADKGGPTAESGGKRIRAPPKRYINESSGKRKAGRPKRSSSAIVVSGEKKKPGRPSLSQKKGPGRPKKGASAMLLLGPAESPAVASPVSASSGMKRKRGRPSASSALVSSKPRGRPPKIEKNGSSAVIEAPSAVKVAPSAMIEAPSAVKEAPSAMSRRGRPLRLKRGRAAAKTKSIASIGGGGGGDVGEMVGLNTAAVGDGLKAAEGNGEMGIDLNTHSRKIGGST